MRRSVSLVLGVTIVISVCGVWTLPLQAEDAPSRLTLEECYQLALKQSESLQRKGEDVKFAEARYQEALSFLYPSIHFSASQRFRNSASSGNTFVGSDFGSSNNVNNSSEHPFATAFSVQQPIFKGFRDIYLAQATEIEVTALKYEETRSAELLYQDVADLFHQIVYFGDDLQILGKTEKVLQQRVTELRDFIRLGKSRDSEIEAAQSDLADLGAAKARVSGVLGSSRELMAFLIGREAQTIRLRPEPSAATQESLDELVLKARGRADVKAGQERVDAAKKELLASERERWPSITLEGNVYPYQDPDNDRDWDVIFRFDVPLYEGGGIDARVAQSQAKERATVLSSKEATRTAEREVRVAYNDRSAALEEVSRLKTLVSTARKNYEAQRRDYELGVVTNLDVLAAIRNVQNAERRLLEAETNVRTNTVRLQVAAGGAP